MGKITKIQANSKFHVKLSEYYAEKKLTWQTGNAFLRKPSLQGVFLAERSPETGFETLPIVFYLIRVTYCASTVMQTIGLCWDLLSFWDSTILVHTRQGQSTWSDPIKTVDTESLMSLISRQTLHMYYHNFFKCYHNLILGKNKCSFSSTLVALKF